MTPVRIKNPDSLCRVVRLQPAQQLEIMLTDDYGANINLQSEYLRIASIDEYIDKRICRIKQTDNAFGSNLHSTFYLGEISLSKGNVLVYLESSDPGKKDTITIVNPGYDAIRMKPHQVLEVVCYNPDFEGKDDKWVWEWQPEVDLEVDQIGYDFAMPYYYPAYREDKIYSIVPRITGDFRCAQHHFWIRFNKSVLELLDENLGRAKYVGKFIFRGFPDSVGSDCVESVIDLFLDGNKKYFNKCVQTLTLPTYMDAVYNMKPSKAQPIARDVAVQRLDSDFEVGCRVIWDERQLCT